MVCAAISVTPARSVSCGWLPRPGARPQSLHSPTCMSAFDCSLVLNVDRNLVLSLDCNLVVKCRSEHCLRTFYESYDFANRTLGMLLGCTAETIEWGPPLGPPLDEWYKCAGRRGQPFCPGIPSKQLQPVRGGDASQGSVGKRPLLQ